MTENDILLSNNTQRGDYRKLDNSESLWYSCLTMRYPLETATNHVPPQSPTCPPLWG